MALGAFGVFLLHRLGIGMAGTVLHVADRTGLFSVLWLSVSPVENMQRS